jgi:hypothetical protein
MFGHEDYIALIRNLNDIISIKEEKIGELDEAGCDALEKIEDMTFQQELMEIKIDGYVAEIKELKKQLAKSAKVTKAPKVAKEPGLPIVKSIKMVRGLPKKVATEAPAKRKPGRPKKVVV